MSKDEKNFDVRVIERYIAEGVLSKKDFDNFIKKLPDSEDKSEVLVIEEKNEEGENKEINDDGSGKELE